MKRSFLRVKFFQAGGGAGWWAATAAYRPTSYSGDYRYAREDKDVDVQLCCCSNHAVGWKGVREILWKAADVLQNKLTRAQKPRRGDLDHQELAGAAEAASVSRSFFLH